MELKWKKCFLHAHVFYFSRTSIIYMNTHCNSASKAKVHSGVLQIWKQYGNKHIKIDLNLNKIDWFYFLDVTEFYVASCTPGASWVCETQCVVLHPCRVQIVNCTLLAFEPHTALTSRIPPVAIRLDETAWSPCSHQF